MPYARLIEERPGEAGRHTVLRTGPLCTSEQDAERAAAVPVQEFSGAHWRFRKVGTCADGTPLVEILPVANGDEDR